MPPKKKVPVRSGKLRTPPSRRFGPRSVTMPPMTSPSGRQMRKASVGINYKLTATRSRLSPSKKLAKPVKDAQETTATTRKRRGRPPANAAAQAVAEPPKAASNPPTRGRPRRKVVEPVKETASKPQKRKRDDANAEPAIEPPKKRGRPAKAVSTAASKVRKPLAQKVAKGGPVQSKKSTITKAVPKPTTKVLGRIGGPPGSKNLTPEERAQKGKKQVATNKASKTNKGTENAVDFVEGLTQPSDQGAADFQYWLMKAEPDTRMEKGIDVAYPIDKLAVATEPEPWDGVRNAVARNNMRAMRKGDLAFFYHSNCAVPGIMGVMRIAEEHSIDESAFDPTHPYYDEKSSRDKPKWDCVKVEFVKKFQDIITLKELKSTPELAQMQIAQKAYGRLSVQTVTPGQWQFVLKMANEPEDLGIISLVSGYEADTNGETDKEAGEDSMLEEDDDIGADKIAAYGQPGDGVNGDGEDEMISEEVQAEKDRVAAIDTFGRELASGEV